MERPTPSVELAENSWRQKLRWVLTKVNLDEHVFLANPSLEAAAAAGASTVGDLYVENYIAGLSSSPLDHSRPLWDLHLLTIRTSEAACVAVFRLSHSIGDGISLMSLLHACTHCTSDSESLPSLPKTRCRPVAMAACFGRLIFLRWICTFLIYAWNTLIEAILLISTAVCLKDTKTVATAFFYRIASNTTLTFSNIVGQIEEVSFCGSNRTPALAKEKDSRVEEEYSVLIHAFEYR
ncbi:hypothetical protein M5K25_013550 [Dendrobium thyrsiflorum]|uniref:Diacylglycerol O-acyltransferase n=1 Tax=Dendrobium thyrsiflorum TaxID=117978 RepID=A0ABD0UT97_DENTH